MRKIIALVLTVLIALQLGACKEAGESSRELSASDSGKKAEDSEQKDKESSLYFDAVSYTHLIPSAPMTAGTSTTSPSSIKESAPSLRQFTT